MKEYTTQYLRNIALIGHGSSGKTTLTESMLFLSGAVNRRGKVEEGTTVTDFDEEEIRRSISLSTGLAPIEWGKYKLNIMDTPGYTDFAGEVKSALRAADLALSVIDSSSGVEVGTELTWAYANEEGVPHMVLVNKMDRENANFDRAMQSLETSFPNQEFLPLLIPIGREADFAGVVNLLEKKAYMGTDGKPADIPADMVDRVDELYTRIVEAAAESDEELMMKYFEDEPLTAEEVANGLRQVILDGSFIPVLAASGGSVIGVKALLSLLTLAAPSPDAHAFKANDDADEFEVSDDSPVALLVFKTTADPYVGKLTYFRVYGGVVNSGDVLYNMRAATDERLGQIYVMVGKEQISVDKLHAGDIGAVAKMGEALTGDTLCNKSKQLTIRGPLFPNPLYSVAIYPKTKGDTAKMGSTLSRICEEDPTLHWNQDSTTHETILSGMGDAHVDTAVRRIQGRFGVNLEIRPPKVPYKETVTAAASAQYRHKKQSGGSGQFAEVHMRIEPLGRDEGFDYVWEVFGGRISSSFMPSIEKGIKSVLFQGVIAGYPIVDVRVAVFDGKEHPVDSKDIAFQIAGREAFKLVFKNAKPSLLEPVYSFDITIPDEFAGAVMSDLNTRRARVQGMDQVMGKAVITAHAPLAEMQQYATNLRAITQGRGIYSMEFLRYDVVPSHLTQEIIAAAKIEEEEE
ncbi:MAG: elongation factor G [Anaerolineae bacterium]|nr:elongation factor G [Anaerolineae bacterium]